MAYFPLHAARNVLASMWANKLIDQNDDPDVPESVVIENLQWHVDKGPRWRDNAIAIQMAMEYLAKRGRTAAIRLLAEAGLASM